MFEILTQLTRKNVKFVWGEEQEEAFKQIEALLVVAPVLSFPRFDLPFVVQTDPNDSGIGAVLSQVVDGKENVLEFTSRPLSNTERKYSVTERECLAVVWAMGKFRPYLQGYRLTVITDHSSLRCLRSVSAPTGRLARWALKLQEHDFKV